MATRDDRTRTGILSVFCLCLLAWTCEETAVKGEETAVKGEETVSPFRWRIVEPWLDPDGKKYFTHA